ncbi:MAG TPA: 3'-5' exonuclease [Bacteroidales bacterium]|nr:3'-5' exonuclease [Bacteroidales bacterium]
MNIKLERPLVFFDLETTGLNIGKDRIIEISLLKILVDGTEISKTYKVNPEIPITEEAFAVHGVSNEDIKNAPLFKTIAHEIAEFMKDCDLAGYNSNKFDIPLLIEEFLRVDIDFDLRGVRFIDVQNIFHKMEPRTLAAAHKFYCKSEIENPHQAEADTRATFNVLKGQIEVYKGTEYVDKKTGIKTLFSNDVKMLSEISSDNRNVDFVGQIILDENDQEIFNFGKHKGKFVRQIFAKEPAYYDWMMKADFSRYTKKVITRIFNEIKFEQLQIKFKK